MGMSTGKSPGHDHGAGHQFASEHPARSDGKAEAHGHSHGLANHATATARHRKKLVIVLCITASVFVVQVVGAILANSLALLADAGHMLTDAMGITIALVASLIAALPATSKRTFGLMRVEVLAAMINGIVLGAIAVIITVEGIRRLGTGVEVAAGPMLLAAILGAVANLVSLMILQSGQKESLNVRGAYLEVLGDLLGSIAVIVAAIVIMVTQWYIVDQLASFVIAILIVPRAYSLLKDVVLVLLEATPRDIDLDTTRQHMLAVPGVIAIHDLHAWTITSGVHVLSAHVVIDERFDVYRYHEILDELHACLGEHFDADHCTFQLEPAKHALHEHSVHA